MKEGLRLKAEHEDDLEVISALLQDALFRVDGMAYQSAQHRFAFVANRFKWENEVPVKGRKKKASSHERIRSALRFEGVLSVQTKNLSLKARSKVLSLLAIRTKKQKDDYIVELVFSGNVEIRMACEMLEVYFDDLTGAWQAKSKPEHSPA